MIRSAQPGPDDPTRTLSESARSASAPTRTPSSDSFESAELRRSGDGLSSSQKLMILVLSMTLYGVGDIVASVLPEISVGPLELGVSYFSFIAVVLAALLNPVWVALGAPLGELVFSDMLLGDFAGLSELEGYLETALAIYIAGVIVRDPCRRAQLALACVTMVLIDKVSGGIIDIVKVAVGIDPETLEESDGLFSAFVIAEGLDIIVTVAFSGVLFGILPAIWLAPRLYGKIEPIMGLRPRDPADPPRLRGPGGIGFWLVAVFAVVAAAAIALLAAWEEFVGKQGLSTIGSFELGADGQPGFGLLAVFGAVVVALGIIIVLAVASKRRRRSVGEGEGQR